jgi:hypothetical protein
MLDNIQSNIQCLNLSYYICGINRIFYGKFQFRQENRSHLYNSVVT